MVESWDHDMFTKSNLIDKFYYKLNHLSPTRGREAVLKGRRAVLCLKFMVSCDAGYYGNRCDVYCKSTNNTRYGYLNLLLTLCNMSIPENNANASNSDSDSGSDRDSGSGSGSDSDSDSDNDNDSDSDSGSE